MQWTILWLLTVPMPLSLIKSFQATVFLKLRKDNTLTTNDSQVPSSDEINLHTDDCACKYLYKYVACFEYDSFEDERLGLNVNTIYIRLQKD